MRGLEPDVVVRTTSSVQTEESEWPIFNWRPRGRPVTVASLRLPKGAKPQGIEPQKKRDLQKAMNLFSGHREAKLYFDSLKVSPRYVASLQSILITKLNGIAVNSSLFLLLIEHFSS